MNKFCVMKWTILENVLVVCSTEGKTSPETWAAYIKDVRTHPVNKVLGLNLGPVEMTSLQRKEASEVMKQKNIKSVVVTNETLVRGIVTAMSWFGSDIKAFGWSNLEEAVKSLGVPPAIEHRMTDIADGLKKACLEGRSK